MKRIALFALLLHNLCCFAQPANDDCSSAISLTMDAGLSCGETTLNVTLEAGECFTNYGGGASEVSTWYSFTATDDSSVLNFVQTNSPNCFPHISVYGPFGSATCQPTCGSSIYSALSNGDPGAHILLTSLTIGQTYMVQIVGLECGGPNDTETDFCIGIANASANGTSAGANLIDECGTAFNETTDGGYWQSGTGTGFANLDNNGATQCGTCAAGLDVPFVINNAAWNTFCALTNGTWQITVDNITNCALTGAGVQAAVFTGTTGNLNLEGSQSPVAGSWSSPVITVNAGDCAYLMLDGFAGDVCDYTVTLTNITGGCTILPIQLISFDLVEESNYARLNWEVKSEIDVNGYRIETSRDGINYIQNGFVKSNPNSFFGTEYSYLAPLTERTYYRLIKLNENGSEEELGIKYLHKTTQQGRIMMNCHPNPSSGLMTVDMTNLQESDLIYFQLFNMQGIMVWSNSIFAENSVTFDFSEIPSDQYILKLTNSESTIVEKIILKK